MKIPYQHLTDEYWGHSEIKKICQSSVHSTSKNRTQTLQVSIQVIIHKVMERVRVMLASGREAEATLKVVAAADSLCSKMLLWPAQVSHSIVTSKASHRMRTGSAAD